MLAASLFGRPVTLRELTPHDLKIELGRLSRDKVARLAHYLGGVFGSAHGRQLDRAGRRSWITELKARSGEGVSASWLWTSVVELLAIHEAAYLEHCRRFPPP
jgi:uncharacterized protein (DUF2252 family)